MTLLLDLLMSTFAGALVSLTRSIMQFNALASLLALVFAGAEGAADFKRGISGRRPGSRQGDAHLLVDAGVSRGPHRQDRIGRAHARVACRGRPFNRSVRRARCPTRQRR